jgi:2-polyprenyl-3-methyl-5-hydroxy-6-metoxy-1,4-benzoquinol methylase
MDQPGLDPAQHAVALDALARVNWLSWTASSLFGHLKAHQQKLGVDRLRILDVASGGGDVAVRLWRMSGRQGLDWRVSGCDFSPFAVEHARQRAQREKALVHFFEHDALMRALPGPYDAVLCTLFLHHLGDDEAVSLLRSMSQLEGGGPTLVLVSDLQRSVVGLLITQIVTRLVTLSRVVHVDGPRSVRAAFTIDEAKGLAGRAGLDGATVQAVWPWRWLLKWERP